MNATQTATPDLFAGTKHAPEAAPLRNRRHEAFCQHLASPDYYDNQTQCYSLAFGLADRAACSSAAARLMRRPEVRRRVEYLRGEALANIGIDRLWILQKRKYIAEHAKSPADQLRAISDLEASLGLAAPQKLDISGSLGVNHSGGMIAISDPAAFARAMEVIRANRENAATPNQISGTPKTP